METQKKIETIPVAEIAKALNTTHSRVLSAMQNGTLPIGVVTENENGRRRGTVIKARWEAWVNAKDLTKTE